MTENLKSQVYSSLVSLACRNDVNALDVPYPQFALWIVDLIIEGFREEVDILDSHWDFFISLWVKKHSCHNSKIVHISSKWPENYSKLASAFHFLEQFGISNFTASHGGWFVWADTIELRGNSDASSNIWSNSDQRSFHCDDSAFASCWSAGSSAKIPWILCSPVDVIIWFNRQPNLRHCGFHKDDPSRCSDAISLIAVFFILKKATWS